MLAFALYIVMVCVRQVSSTVLHLSKDFTQIIFSVPYLKYSVDVSVVYAPIDPLVDLTTLKQNDLVKPYNSWVVFHIYCHYYFPKAQKLPTDTIVGLVCLLFTKTVFCFLKLLSPEHIWK